MAHHPQASDDLLFVGFNGRVIALDRNTGAIIWKWNEGSKGNYVTLLPDGDVLFVSCRGYTWALDPLSGASLWHQPLKGEGTGIASLATMRRGPDNASAAAAARAEEEQQAAAAAAAS